jgi:translation initiation factor 1
MSDDDRRLVYSTDGTLPLPKVERAKGKPRPKGAAVPDDDVVRVGCERRRGGQVTLVYGLAARELQQTAAELKRLCGTGGTAKDGIVTLQGDKRDAILAYFANGGRRVKRMGG